MRLISIIEKSEKIALFLTITQGNYIVAFKKTSRVKKIRFFSSDHEGLNVSTPRISDVATLIGIRVEYFQNFTGDNWIQRAVDYVSLMRQHDPA